MSSPKQDTKTKHSRITLFFKLLGITLVIGSVGLAIYYIYVKQTKGEDAAKEVPVVKDFISVEEFVQTPLWKKVVYVILAFVFVYLIVDTINQVIAFLRISRKAAGAVKDVIDSTTQSVADWVRNEIRNDDKRQLEEMKEVALNGPKILERIQALYMKKELTEADYQELDDLTAQLANLRDVHPHVMAMIERRVKNINRRRPKEEDAESKEVMKQVLEEIETHVSPEPYEDEETAEEFLQILINEVDSQIRDPSRRFSPLTYLETKIRARRKRKFLAGYFERKFSEMVEDLETTERQYDALRELTALLLPANLLADFKIPYEYKLRIVLRHVFYFFRGNLSDDERLDDIASRLERHFLSVSPIFGEMVTDESGQVSLVENQELRQRAIELMRQLQGFWRKTTSMLMYDLSENGPDFTPDKVINLAQKILTKLGNKDKRFTPKIKDRILRTVRAVVDPNYEGTGDWLFNWLKISERFELNYTQRQREEFLFRLAQFMPLREANAMARRMQERVEVEGPSQQETDRQRRQELEEQGVFFGRPRDSTDINNGPDNSEANE